MWKTAKKKSLHSFNKLHSIWVFPRRSSEAKSICKEILGCTLNVPCETRWNSKFDAISHVFKLKPKLNEYVDKLKEKIQSASLLSKPTPEDWIVMGTYLKIMEPIAMTLDSLQGEKYCGQGYSLPSLLAMKHRIQMATGGRLLKHFQDTMLNAVERRFHNYFKIDATNTELIVAALSVPRFKSSFIIDEIECNVAHKLLISECMELAPEISNEVEANTHI